MIKSYFITLVTFKLEKPFMCQKSEKASLNVRRARRTLVG